VHSNVDTLSRPVLTVSVANTSVCDILVITTTDPLEDEALLHFLKFGRHLAGNANANMCQPNNHTSNMRTMFYGIVVKLMIRVTLKYQHVQLDMTKC
jgi:hypothetical protein